MKLCYGWPNSLIRGRMHGGRFSGMMGGHGFGGRFLMLLLWALVIAGIVYLVIRLTRGSSSSVYKHQTDEDAAIDILRQRFAKGEMDKQEFEEKMKTLK